MTFFHFDRRYLFGFMALAVALPLLFPLHLPNEVTPDVRHFYNIIDSLPAGSAVLVSFDHEASTIAEVRPLATAVIRHLFQKKVGIIGISLLAEGTGIGRELLLRLGKEYGKQEGTDFAFLGFRPQYAATISGLGEDIRQVFPADYRDRPLDSLPLFAHVRNLSDLALVISVADGDLPATWVDYAVARYHQKVAAAVTAVMATTYYPYLNSGQLVGLVSGLKGASEYELLLHKPGGGVRGMDAQSVAHLALLLLIGLGNLAYLASRKKATR